MGPGSLLAALLAAEPSAAQAPPPEPPPVARSYSNDDFTLPRGLRVGNECLRAAKVGADEIESALEAAVRGAERCRSRLSPWVHGRFRAAIRARPEVHCLPWSCGERADACASARGNRVNFRILSAVKDPSVWFHELLHLGGVDNQGVEAHNDPSVPFWERAERDEVYYWQSSCFAPEELVQRFRDGSYSRCRAALARTDRPGRRPHPQEDIDRACGFFWDYLERETGFAARVREGPFQELFACRDGEELAACPDLDAIGSSLRASGRGGLLPRPDGFLDWVRDRCALYDSRWQRAPWAAAHPCLSARGLAARWDAELAEAGLGAGAREDLLSLLEVMRRKAAAFGAGPDYYQEFPELALRGRASELEAAAARPCREDAALGRTGFCRLLLDETLPEMRSLLSAW